MRVFVSWSGEQAKLLATHLVTWIRQVVQSANPWMSESIEKGKRWSPEIAERLEESKIGIICVTRENRDAPWLLFEAGALSKTKDAHVCTLLLDVTSADMQGPLAQFQHTACMKDDIRTLIATINRTVRASGATGLEDADLHEIFELHWPKLEQAIATAKKTVTSGDPPRRPDRELLEEVLDLVRGIDRRERNRAKHLEFFHSLDDDALRRTFESTRMPVLREHMSAAESRKFADALFHYAEAVVSRNKGSSGSGTDGA